MAWDRLTSPPDLLSANRERELLNSQTPFPSACVGERVGVRGAELSRHNARLQLLLSVLLLALTAWGATSPQSTAIAVPPTSQILLTTNVAPTTASSEQVWKKQPVGASNM